MGVGNVLILYKLILYVIRAEVENVNEINKVKINLIRFSLTIHKNNKNFSLNSVRSSSVHSTSIYIPCLSGCLFVCFYPINVKTAEPNGPKFFCGASHDPREGLGMIKS